MFFFLHFAESYIKLLAEGYNLKKIKLNDWFAFNMRDYLNTKDFRTDKSVQSQDF